MKVHAGVQPAKRRRPAGSAGEAAGVRQIQMSIREIAERERPGTRKEDSGWTSSLWEVERFPGAGQHLGKRFANNLNIMLYLRWSQPVLGIQEPITNRQMPHWGDQEGLGDARFSDWLPTAPTHPDRPFLWPAPAPHRELGVGFRGSHATSTMQRFGRLPFAFASYF